MMQFFIFSFLLLNSMGFFFMNHPISMMFILIIQTILSILFIGLISKTFWFSYSLFLIFLGGLLILFMYMTSLASNELFKFSNLTIFNFFIIMILSLIMMLIFDFKILSFNKTFNLENSNMFFFKNMFMENSMNLNKIYNFPTNFISIILMNYLFLTLIASVKISNIYEGPLRSKN